MNLSLLFNQQAKHMLQRMLEHQFRERISELCYFELQEVITQPYQLSLVSYLVTYQNK